MSVDPVVWGKQKGLPPNTTYPLICHMLDSAALVGALWDELLTEQMRARLAATLGLSVGELRSQVMLWAGLHDLGKVTPAFQSAVPFAFERVRHSWGDMVGLEPSDLKLRHERATHLALPQVLSEFGYPTALRPSASVSHQIAQMLGGHHGVFGEALSRQHIAAPAVYKPGLGRGAWESQRIAHARAVRDVLGVTSVVSGLLPAEAAVPILGMIMIADWLASQINDVKGRLPPRGWAASEWQLREHWSSVVDQAPGIVAEAGLGGAHFSAALFNEAFPDFEPNPLQRSIARRLPTLVDGPGLLLITAPAGDGKSEAGWYAASVMARASGANGVYWAMPTMSMADEMFKRVRGFVTGQVTGAQAVTLAHSLAFLNPAFTPPGEKPLTVEDVTLATSWLWGPRRPLLARFSVGTVDHVLAGVLPTRFNMLRLASLYGKVLIIDEAHAYDAWMQQLMVRLLEWCGAMGVPVVMMSATLAGRVSSPLVAAYRRGAGHSDESMIVPKYPGWAYVDAHTGQITPSVKVGTDRPRRLAIALRAVRTGAARTDSDSREAQVRRALTALRDSNEGCAMVVCATVTVAQQTYRDLLRWLGATDVEVRLLHSRFPAWRRAEITRECEALYGKPERDVKQSRPASILVATSVVEAAVDLDFDLVVSDLAVLASLLQRAGRAWRHQRLRPSWAGETPSLVVLDPVDANGELLLPVEWEDLYPRSLLRRTRALIAAQRKPVAIPGDVQKMIDAVYADDFVDRLDAAAGADLAAFAAHLRSDDTAWLAGDMAERGLANLAMIKPPADCRNLAKISLLDGGSVSEDLITTRLGADSDRVVCLYAQPDGRRTLDPAGVTTAPGEPTADGRLPRTLNDAELRAVLNHTIPVPASWLRGIDDLAPKAWSERSLSRAIIGLEMRAVDDVWINRSGKRPLGIDTDAALGLFIS